jgi:tetratricopeptide (TPR) repeat protein
MGQRDTFLEVPAGERRRQVTTELQDANSRTRLVRLHVDEADLRDYDRPVTVRMVFEIPNHFTGSPEREGSVSDSKVWNKLLAYTLDYERTVGLELGQPFQSRHRYRIHLPPAYHLDTVPKEKTIRTPWAVFTRTVKMPDDLENDRDIEIEFFTRLDRALIEPADFEAFRKFHEEVGSQYRAWLTLKPANELSEAPLLEATLSWSPWDGDSSAILARLYLDHKRPTDARRVLQRARFYRPEDMELWELSVAAADSSREKEAIERELVHRFPGEVKHTLNLGSLLVSAGRQEEARALLEPLTKKGKLGQRAQAHFQLARSYYRRDELPQALKHWEMAAEADNDIVHSVRAYHLKGRIHEEMGQPAAAEKAYEDALTVDRESELALDSLVRLELAAKDRRKALKYLRRYAVAVRDDRAGLLRAAGYYLRLGHYDDAWELATRIGGRWWTW